MCPRKEHPAGANTTYALTCQGLGPNVTQEIEIAVRALKIDSFSSSVTAFGVDGGATLSWQTQYANSCSISVKEGNGSVTVPVQNNQTTSCKVSATTDGKTLIFASMDGSAELGRITLPTPSPLAVTFLLSVTAHGASIQSQYVVTLLQVQINRFDKASQLVGHVDPASGMISGYFVDQVVWQVSNAGSVQVFYHGNQVSTLPSGTWQSPPLSRPPRPEEFGNATITANGFGGPVLAERMAQ